MNGKAEDDVWAPLVETVRRERLATRARQSMVRNRAGVHV
jgi:hypothetical protein